MEGRKDKTPIQNSKNLSWQNLWHFLDTLCVRMLLAITSALWNSQQLPKMLTHLWLSSSPLNVPFLTSLPYVFFSWLSILALTYWPHVLESTDHHRVLGFEHLTPYSQNFTPNLTNILCPFPILQVPMGTALCIVFAPK